MIFDNDKRLNMKDSQRSYILHSRHTIHPTVSHAISHIVSHIVSHVVSHITSRITPHIPLYPNILFYPTHPTLSHVLGLVILTITCAGLKVLSLVAGYIAWVPKLECCMPSAYTLITDLTPHICVLTIYICTLYMYITCYITHGFISHSFMYI